MANNIIFKKANATEIKQRWKVNIANNPGDKRWVKWSQEFLENYKKKYIDIYIAKHEKRIIAEMTVNYRITPKMRESKKDKADMLIIEGERVYMAAFRIDDDFAGKGIFSKLYKFAEADLKKRGFKFATIGVEPAEERNRAIYTHWGYTEFLFNETEQHIPEQGGETEISETEYFRKNLL